VGNRPSWASLAVSICALSEVRPVDAQLVDQSDVNSSAGFYATDWVPANDFVVATTQRFDAVTLWIRGGDPDDDGVVEGLDAGISWAILPDDSGPDENFILASGFEPSPLRQDAGFNVQGEDAERIRLVFQKPFTLPPGTYWIAFREGEWGDPADGDGILLLGAAAVALQPSQSFPLPSGSWSSSTFDFAMVLESEPWSWQQGEYTIGGASNISNWVIANDFVLPQAARPTSLDVWLTDQWNNNNNQLDGFVGTLSWAIYTNVSSKPGVVVASGADMHPRLLDTQEYYPPYLSEVFRVSLRLEGLPELAAGTYWLALHEGEWGDGFDGSGIEWMSSVSTVGQLSVSAADETAPGNWQTGISDVAFSLFDDSIFGSRFEAGTACAWTMPSPVLCD
jgi:hypothetical protein